ncbi:hypothetical protein M413DRAFT_30195 [Hebeloma cylindrosporum]|uniref:Uncharacterized protein n=1 Tax=Hebeloma cylindrosporum TaxID=76867 RepID=A0A0C3BNV3_HEBCY|nr:hypothetical protein M413DRAFT_30195 [Hebeloma cylindrosporum h7]
MEVTAECKRGDYTPLSFVYDKALLRLPPEAFNARPQINKEDDGQVNVNSVFTEGLPKYHLSAQREVHLRNMYEKRPGRNTCRTGMGERDNSRSVKRLGLDFGPNIGGGISNMCMASIYRRYQVLASRSTPTEWEIDAEFKTELRKR